MKKLSVSMVLALLAACASRQPEPEPQPDTVPPPVEITEAPEPGAAPQPDQPPPPDMPQKPMQTDAGMFRVSIASLEAAEGTARWVRKAEEAGYRTEVLAVEIDGKTWHRVLLPGYASLAEAQAALPFIQQDLAAPDAWVTSRRRAPGPADAPAEAPPPPPPEPEPTPAN
ncbi:MAG: SPOR domain-containing protein [Nevskiaceae bacterium]